MQAISYEAIGEVRSSAIAKPEPANGETIVRVRASGICHTDIDILYGYRKIAELLHVFGVVLVPTVVQCLSGPSQSNRRNQLCLEACGTQTLGQGPMIIARHFEGGKHWPLISSQ